MIYSSGLDIQAAENVMVAVKDIAKSNRTVICTIHQPSTKIFSKFDSLILLTKGGNIVFNGELGERSSNMLDYFQRGIHYILFCFLLF